MCLLTTILLSPSSPNAFFGDPPPTFTPGFPIETFGNDIHSGSQGLPLTDALICAGTSKVPGILGHTHITIDYYL